MKKSLIALAVLGSFAGVAAAQSSVTLFGVVDMSARQVKNSGGTVRGLATDGYNSSRLGFRGVEDLGGGMRAGFWLEAGMANDTGNAGGSTGLAAPTNGSSNLFNRRSTASLMGGFGEIRLGRDYTPQFWNTTVFDVFGTNGLGSSLNPVTTNLGGAVTFVRSNNSIGYLLPAMGGLYGQVQVSAAEGNVNGNKHASGRLGFQGGPVNVAVASGTTKTTAGDYKQTNLGASFKLGNFGSLSGYVNESKLGAIKHQTSNLGVSIPVGALELRASYTDTNTKGGGLDTRDATQAAVGFVYNMSKRTAVYGTYSQIDNEAGANYTVGGPGAANGLGKKSTGTELGVRHSF